MIYCKLEEKQIDSAIYHIGTTVGNLSGKIMFFADERKLLLLEQADNDAIRILHIVRLYNKYRPEFEKGIFPDKLAIEIG